MTHIVAVNREQSCSSCFQIKKAVDILPPTCHAEATPSVEKMQKLDQTQNQNKYNMQQDKALPILANQLTDGKYAYDCYTRNKKIKDTKNKTEMTMEIVTSLYTHRAFLPSVRKKWVRLIEIVFIAVPPILDYATDYMTAGFLSKYYLKSAMKCKDSMNRM